MAGELIAPWGLDGVWLRCNFHSHTTESDGMLSAPMLRRYYALGGYDVLAITDHDRRTALPVRDDRFAALLLVPGIELSLRAPRSRGPLHVLGIGVGQLPVVTRDSLLSDAVAAIRSAGGVAVVAHPWWSGLLPDELDDLDGVAAIEVYNAGCEVEQGRGNSALYWDTLLARGVRINAIATDDHHMPGFDAFRGWTLVRAAERTVEAVVAALSAGAFYSSCGPSILALRLEPDGLVVECSPAVSITMVAQPPMGLRVNAGAHGLFDHVQVRTDAAGRVEGTLDGDLLTWARFPRYPGARYVRVEVTDAHGRTAWSNPVWTESAPS